MKPVLPRIGLAAMFVLALAFVRGEKTVAPVEPRHTEEGQMVVFDRSTWQMRELAKKLPLDEPWPSGAATAKALAKYGLDRNTPPQAIPVPARIAQDVFLVGQDHVSNLTYMI